MRSISLILLAVSVLFLARPALAQDAVSYDEEWKTSVAVFGGWMTDNSAADIYTPWELEFRDSYLAGVALNRRLFRYKDLFDIEIEGQVVRHFGDENHWEFNVPVVGRWRKFPWDETVETSFAFGLGLSYATDVPTVELENNSTSENWLIYWTGEIELGPPGSQWSGIARLHHRSDGFGVVADDGGSNAIVIGARRRF